MRKVIEIGDNALLKVVQGLDRVADAVEMTLGPSGRNAIIQRPYQDPLITNDGITVAKETYLDDELEELGASVIKEATRRTNDIAGDGTSTTTCLTRAIVKEGMKVIGDKDSLVSKNKSVMSIKRQIDSECKQAIEILEKSKKLIKSKEDLEKVATVSMEDETTGKMIAEIFNKIGDSGVVLTEIGFKHEMFYTLNEGFDVDFGFITPIMEESNGKVEIENPRILVTTVPIESPEQIKPIISQIANETRTLFIFCTQISDAVILNIIKNKLSGAFNVVVVKIPPKNDIIYDIEASLKAKIFDKEIGDKLETCTKEQLGTCQKIIVTKDKATIIGGADIKDYIEKLNKTKEESKSLFDKEQIEKRIAKISNGIAIISVPNNSESEYLKLKIEDAVNATRCALKEGTVKGGGLALKEVSEQMKGTLIENALKRPYEVIQSNNGEPLEIPEYVRDPFLVVKTALENAGKIAGLFLTTGIAIADKKEKPKDITLDD